jgi:hypothetical protein
MKIAIPLFCIQKPPKIEVVEESMFNLYTRIVQKYIKDRELIPKGNLVEVRYEDFVTQPLQQIKNIYETLQMEGFGDAEPAFDTYLRTQWIIKKDQYSMDDELKQKIEKKWGFAIKEFGY